MFCYHGDQGFQLGDVFFSLLCSVWFSSIDSEIHHPQLDLFALVCLLCKMSAFACLHFVVFTFGSNNNIEPNHKCWGSFVGQRQTRQTPKGLRRRNKESDKDSLTSKWKQTNHKRRRLCSGSPTSKQVKVKPENNERRARGRRRRKFETPLVRLQKSRRFCDST